MTSQVFGAEVTQALAQAQRRARESATLDVVIDGQARAVPSPFPSPADWRDRWIYFLVTDRFNNPAAPPVARWNGKFNFHQGGTFEGVRRQLGYLRGLGVGAIWLSPVLKNSRPDGFEYTYPGYNTQDFLNVDERFASDGTRATAERELAALVAEAHARGMHVILDIVLNHAARIFDYIRNGSVTDRFTDAAVMAAPPGQEPSIAWLNGLGFPRADWRDDLPAPAALSPDDAVWPVDLQRKEFFRRRGTKLSDAPGPEGFVRGDFAVLRQLVPEYDATGPDQEALLRQYGPSPVLSILIRAYQYLVAKYDFDGFRIDTVKYVRPDIVETFGNAIREYALSIGKVNFFTFGEIYDSEDQINRFIGRNGSDTDGFGIDAALDFPLFFVLPGVAKARTGVEAIRDVFEKRKNSERGLISSHGEAGRYFVSFIDNHDQNNRFNDPGTPEAQVSLALALLFSLQGIPCLYYGTEQGLQGTSDDAGRSTLDSNESVREALWGKPPPAFDPTSPLYREIAAISSLRGSEPALRYGRLYFREVSGPSGQDFGMSTGAGGVVAYSRVLNDREVVVVANTHFSRPFDGFVLVDFFLNQTRRTFRTGYSNEGTSVTTVAEVRSGRIFQSGGSVERQIASLEVSLKPMEVQIWVPA